MENQMQKLTNKNFESPKANRYLRIFFIFMCFIVLIQYVQFFVVVSVVVEVRFYNLFVESVVFIWLYLSIDFCSVAPANDDESHFQSRSKANSHAIDILSIILY